MGYDKRKDVRMAVLEGAFIEFEEGCDIVGTLVDIARHGLSFTYEGDPGLCFPFSRICADISIPENGFSLEDVACRVVYDDVAHDMDDTDISAATVTKQCGVEFCELTEEQQEKLEFFIGCIARKNSL